MNVENPEELVEVLVQNSRSRKALSSFIEDIIAKNHSTVPSKAVPLDVVRDAFSHEFKDRINSAQVPWGELDQTIVQDMVNYVRSVMSFGEGGKRYTHREEQ
ncbi:uncharacterized protein LOC144652331 [Oculina patagonica]